MSKTAYPTDGHPHQWHHYGGAGGAGGVAIPVSLGHLHVCGDTLTGPQCKLEGNSCSCAKDLWP
jgi:hypothetical protein